MLMMGCRGFMDFAAVGLPPPPPYPHPSLDPPSKPPPKTYFPPKPNQPTHLSVLRWYLSSCSGTVWKTGCKASKGFATSLPPPQPPT